MFFNDTTTSPPQKLVEKLNAELCNTLGNLLSRVVGKNLNPRQYFPSPCPETFRQFGNAHLDTLVESLHALPARFDESFESLRIDRGVDAIMAVLREANLFLQSARPWKMDASLEQERIRVVLYVIMETLRVCGILLQPIVPGLAGRVLDVIGVEKEERTVIRLKDDLTPLHRVTLVRGSEDSAVDVPLKSIHTPLYPRLQI